jgi:hypothetical protein
MPLASLHAGFARIGGILAFAVLLASCGGGGAAADPAPRSAGILSGTMQRGGQSYGLQAIATADGRFMAYDSGGWFYDGTYPIPGAFETSHFVSLFEVDPEYLNDGASFDHLGFYTRGVELVDLVITGTGAQGSLLLGETEECPLCEPTADLATFELVYDRALDALDASFASIAGDWEFTNGNYALSLAVGEGGATSTSSRYLGNPLDCSSAGAATVPDAGHNVYGWQTTPSGSQCGDSAAMAPYDGLGFVSGSAPEGLTVLLNNGSRFLALRFVRPAS